MAGKRIITVTDPLEGVDTSEYEISYDCYPGNIAFDIIDMEGTVDNVRSGDLGSFDIVSLSSRVLGSDIWITVGLAGDPLDPSKVGTVMEARYEVFFVKEGWEEPEFNSPDTTPETPSAFIPSRDRRFSVGTYMSTGYLTYGREEGDYGSPVVNGRNITWRVPIELLINSGMGSSDFRFYCYVGYSEESLLKVTRAFDTAGYGSNQHLITEQPSDDGKEKESIIWVLYMAIPILLVLLLAAVLTIILLLVKRKVQDKGEPVPYQSVPPHLQHQVPISTQPIAPPPMVGYSVKEPVFQPGGDVPPYPMEQGENPGYDILENR
jgi:hypothetical protein